MLRCVPAASAPAQVPRPSGHEFECGVVDDDRGAADPSDAIGAYAPAASTAPTITTAARAQVPDSSSEYGRRRRPRHTGRLVRDMASLSRRAGWAGRAEPPKASNTTAAYNSAGR